MKYGYTCKCGWHLSRTGTRRGYAYDKEQHAKTCAHLRKELEESRKIQAK